MDPRLRLLSKHIPQLRRFVEKSSMGGFQFHETGYGKRFFDGQLPQLLETLGRIADSLEKQNNPLVRMEDNGDLVVNVGQNAHLDPKEAAFAFAAGRQSGKSLLWAELLKKVTENMKKRFAFDKVIDGINWDMLAHQKEMLLNLANRSGSEDSQALDGVIHMIDDLQDAAAEVGIWTFPGEEKEPCASAVPQDGYWICKFHGKDGHRVCYRRDCPWPDRYEDDAWWEGRQGAEK